MKSDQIISHSLTQLRLNPASVQEFRCDLNSVSLLAKEIVKILLPGDWIFFNGDMGTGKTTLTKLISHEYRVQDLFTSPTFSILNSSDINFGDLKRLIHLDLYRIKTGKEICYIGLEQLFQINSSIAIFEWPELVEEEDWIHFFQLTQCPKPKRILNIDIENMNNERNYKFFFNSFF
jgi:tRNA threonylcarbamoyladenosine biosynthesis protein TsaE